MKGTATKYNKLSISLLIISISVIHVSCKKFLEIKPAPNLIKTNAIFSNDNTALSAALGVYVQMRKITTYFTNNGMSIFAGLSADEIYNTSSNKSYDPFYNNSLLSTTPEVATNFYNMSYKNIYTVNSILEGLNSTSSLTDSLRDQLIGEMKFVRAFYYFYLVNLFNDVPLVISTDYGVNAVLPRTSAAQVYQQIVADLKDAQNLLKPGYPSSGKIRPNKYVATALLARVYLYRKEWENAEIQASTVINGGYDLVSDLNKVFLINSNETIWELASPNEASNTAQGSSYIPSSSIIKPSLAITTNLLNAFEPGDLRKSNWLKSNTINSVIYYYPYKFKVRTSTLVTEYNIVIRLAEIYLIRAEARAMQNDFSGAQADLNKIRNRAGLPLSYATDQQSLLSEIEHERQVELFTEWGDRWLNLKRTNRADAVLSVFKGANWQSTDALYPIPYNELQYNVFLTQNPGY